MATVGKNGTSRFDVVHRQLQQHPKRWLLTGVAGFIGSHLLETLLKLGQNVVGVDNFVSGSEANLADVRARVGEAAWEKFHFVYGDICDPECCKQVSAGAEIVLHQAALGSVPRSIEDPISTNRINVEGTLNVFRAAVAAGAKRVVYASSSSVYGDIDTREKQEDRLGVPLSPYAASKRTCELYAATFLKCYQMPSIGLRYFNVFGPRQNPNGDYAAVIPRWIQTVVSGERGKIFGDGTTTRDFCNVANVVQANILAATCSTDCASTCFNVGGGRQTNLSDLYRLIAKMVCSEQGKSAEMGNLNAAYEPFRAGDVLHSLASLDLVRKKLGYEVLVELEEGLQETVSWFVHK